MANVTALMQPVTGQENINKIRPQAPSENLNQAHQVTDPTKIVKTQNQSVFQDRQQGQVPLNLDSNFEKFISMLKNTPNLSQSLAEFFFSKTGNVVTSGISENFTQEIMKFLELIKVDEKQLLEMLRGQQGQNMRFSGPFFDILRQIMNSSNNNANMNANINSNMSVSNDLKLTILNFLKQFDSLTSSNHTLNNIVSNLRNLSVSIPATQGDILSQITDKLSMEQMVGNNPKNLEILKNEIMPFLSKYISATKDLGAVRNLIAILTLNIAKYESGSKDTFIQSLRELVSFSEVGKYVRGATVEDLAAQLIKAGQIRGNELIDRFISIIAKGMSGESGFQSKAVFQNIVSSILINESVYMPLLHLIIPANLSGGMFFSELWIDPNAGENAGGEDGASPVKLLVKFDIRDVGFFESIIYANNKIVDMELYYPEKYKDRENEMRIALTEIMAKNELTFRSLFLAKVEKPKSITEVFPQIYDRRNAINVTV
jgi:hypothetical protein